MNIFFLKLRTVYEIDASTAKQHNSKTLFMGIYKTRIARASLGLRMKFKTLFMNDEEK